MSQLILLQAVLDVQDKTFGLKNKKGAKQQKFIQQVQKQVTLGNKSAKDVCFLRNFIWNKMQLERLEREKQEKKELKKREKVELNELFKPVAELQKCAKGEFFFFILIAPYSRLFQV